MPTHIPIQVARSSHGFHRQKTPQSVQSAKNVHELCVLGSAFKHAQPTSTEALLTTYYLPAKRHELTHTLDRFPKLGYSLHEHNVTHDSKTARHPFGQLSYMSMNIVSTAAILVNLRFSCRGVLELFEKTGPRGGVLSCVVYCTNKTIKTQQSPLELIIRRQDVRMPLTFGDK